MPENNPKGLSPEQARSIAEECYGEVLAYCRRHAPAEHDAADLAQETFLRFVRARSYRERGKPIAYLMRIARNVCIDASNERRLETVQLDLDVEDKGELERVFELEAALVELPDELREVVELRFASGFGVGEVAQVLGISRFAVRRRINAALNMLREELEKGDRDE